MPVHLPDAHSSSYNLAQLLLDSSTTRFGAYNLQVSLLPAEQSLLDLLTPSLQHILLSQNLTLHLSVPSFPFLYNSCNSHARSIHWTSAPGRHLGVERVGKDWRAVRSQAPGGDGSSSWHPASSAISLGLLKRQSLHHNTFSVRKLLSPVAVTCSFCREEGFQLKCPRFHWFFSAAFWARYS